MRIRPGENSFIETNMEKPYEVHLITFATETDFGKFMEDDEERKRFLHLKEQSIKSVILIKGTKI